MSLLNEIQSIDDSIFLFSSNDKNLAGNVLFHSINVPYAPIEQSIEITHENIFIYIDRTRNMLENSTIVRLVVTIIINDID